MRMFFVTISVESDKAERITFTIPSSMSMTETNCSHCTSDITIATLSKLRQFNRNILKQTPVPTSLMNGLFHTTLLSYNFPKLTDTIADPLESF